jgi:photosystem II stability/assembly factor-like uncharacterized protein
MELRIAWQARLSLVLLVASCLPAAAQEAAHPFEKLELRSIGPAVMGGRVTDFAFHPTRRQEFYAAHAVGGLWKTTNNAITWTPVFENEGSYSIGVVTIDPSNPNTVWVGTGENNSQRSVAYGDGVYKSLDGGQSWSNMGLRRSEHISQIHVDPEDSENVLVAAQGPLWNSGGDRGLYRTIDGGETWQRILETDDYTGVNEFVVHPENPGHIIASTVQRGRHVWGIVGGGPGSGLWKTTDGGQTWRELTAGIPAGDKGRIGLAMAPSSPNIVYAIVFAEDDKSGFYRSTDFGESWTKRSDRMSNDAQYYNEITVDPQNPERVFSVDTFSWITEDGGLTWERLGLKRRHVDDHAFWIDPQMTEHLYVGGDGTMPCRITTSTGAHRMRAPGVDLRGPCSCTELPIRTGGTYAAATVSNRRSTRRTQTSCTPSRSMQVSCATTGALRNVSASSRSRTVAKPNSPGTGPLR